MYRYAKLLREGLQEKFPYGPSYIWKRWIEETSEGQRSGLSFTADIGWRMDPVSKGGEIMQWTFDQAVPPYKQ